NMVLAGCVADGPPAPGRSHGALHARPAPYSSVPHGPTSGGGLPTVFRVGSLVTRIPGASAGPRPGGPGGGAGARTSLEFGVCTVGGGHRLAVTPRRSGGVYAGRGHRRACDRAGLSRLCSPGNDRPWVGAGHAGPGRGGIGTGLSGDRRLSGHRGRGAHAILSYRTGGRL